jgi:hypothetical protein
MSQNGLAVIRYKDVDLVDRMTVDNWPVRIGLYYTDPVYGVKTRMIDYDPGAIEPRHVHPGKHGTTIARGRVLAEGGVILGPLDVILGPSNEPHGPFEYPDGCNLISFFRGDDFHNEEAAAPKGKQHRLIKNETIPWQKAGEGEVKLLVDSGLDDMVVEAWRFPPGAKLAPGFIAAVVLEGSPEVNGECLGKWDLVHPVGKGGGTVAFPEGGMIVAASMR